MFEMLISNYGTSSRIFPDSGPGEKILHYGTMMLGFFGEVETHELFTAQELSLACGVNNGTLNTASTMTWLKYMYKGKVLFIPKQPIRRNLSWITLYSLGLVYGTDTDGPRPREGGSNQYITVKKDQYTFKVRLLTGDESEPTFITGSIKDPATEPTETEWTQLLYSSVSKSIASKPVTDFPRYTESDLGFSATGDWVQEQNETLTSALVRGNSSQVDYLNLLSITSNANWRPVLELIEGPEPLLRPLDESGRAKGLEPLYGLKTDFNDVPNPIIHAATDIHYDTNALWSAQDVQFDTSDALPKPWDIHYETDALWATHSLKATPQSE